MQKIQHKFTFEGFEIYMLKENPIFSFDFDRKTGYTLHFNVLSYPCFRIYDNNCDGKAEKVLLDRTSYKRGQKGTERIFEKADNLLAEKLEQLNIEAIRKEWEEKLGKYKTKEEYYSDMIQEL